MRKHGPLIDHKPAAFLNLCESLRSGNRRFTLEYLHTLERAFKEREPRVQAFVQGSTLPFEQVRKALEQLYEKYPEPASRPALFGIPVGIKDIIHAEGFPTRGGSRLPPEVICGQEATVVRRLKKSGAIVFGKTITVEFANEGPGPTRNPHHLGHTPGGSSSGSAAAVAAGLCPLALGTQTVSSTIRPAAYCGVVGFKPTYGRIPVEGIIPLAPSLDTVGIFATDHRGAGAAASILIEGWQAAALCPTPVLGLPVGPYLERADRKTLKHFYGICDVLGNAGVRLKSIDFFKDLASIEEAHLNLGDGEFAIVHGEWFKTYAEQYSHGNRQAILRGQKHAAKTLAKYRASRIELRNRIMETMSRHGIAAFIAPAATGPAPKGLEFTGNWIMNLPWTHAGVPVVSIPSGKSEKGLPMGLQIIGKFMQDEALLCLAASIGRMMAKSLR